MIKQAWILTLLVLITGQGVAQQTYTDSINQYINDYVSKHEVVTGEDRRLMSFFPVSENCRVTARFERSKNIKWFDMPTSGNRPKAFRVYGTIYFTLNDTAAKMNIYQSRDLLAISEYKDNLFLPFTDRTSGAESYAGGRYIDLKLDEIAGEFLVVDFNKAYNPYCAYVSGKYNCPIPPRENHLPVAVRAGERAFDRH